MTDYDRSVYLTSEEIKERGHRYVRRRHRPPYLNGIGEIGTHFATLDYVAFFSKEIKYFPLLREDYEFVTVTPVDEPPPVEKQRASLDSIVLTQVRGGCTFYYRLNNMATIDPWSASRFMVGDPLLLRAEEEAKASATNWKRSLLQLTIEDAPLSLSNEIDLKMRDELRARALAKLSPEERAALDLVDPAP